MIRGSIFLFFVFILIPSNAFSFSRKPIVSCETDAECVLVRMTHCGDSRLHSIRLGQDKEWAAWDRRQSEKGNKSAQCEGPLYLDPRLAEPFCSQGICQVRPKSPPLQK
jgi:hypothetical protein